MADTPVIPVPQLGSKGWVTDYANKLDLLHVTLDDLLCNSSYFNDAIITICNKKYKVEKNNLYNISFKESTTRNGTYIILHALDNKKYVGSSGKVASRIYTHRNRLKRNVHDSLIFQELFNASNPVFFDIIVFYTEDREEAFNLEQYFVDLLRDSDLLINKDIFNVRNPSEGCKISEAHLQALIKANTGRIISEETRKKIGLKSKGRKCTEEVKEKLSLLYTGVPLSPEHKQKIKDSKVNSCRAVSAEGIIYKSMTAAATALNLPFPSFFHRVKSKNRPDYFYIENKKC